MGRMMASVAGARAWRRTAALAAVLALAAGCGGPQSTVAVESAAGGPRPGPTATGAAGQAGTPGGTEGAGGAGATAGPAAETGSGATPAQLACIHRNDDVVPWREYVEPGDLWHRQHAQEAHKLIFQAVRSHLKADVRDESKNADKLLTNGFEGYDLDIVGRRLIMMVDPDLIDPVAFGRWVSRYAVGANKDAKVRGRPVTVTVQSACFPVREVEQIRTYLHQHWDDLDLGSMDGTVFLDGRVHGYFCDQDAGHRLQRRFPVLAVDGCMRTEPM